jgi:hypothetical protein
MLMPHHQNAQRNHNVLVKIALRYFGSIAKLRYLERITTDQNFIHDEVKRRLSITAQLPHLIMKLIYCLI